MSVDPLAAGGADLAAILDAEIAALAADAQSLSELLVVNAVVSARVLPSNGLTDLVEIAGRRVAASLPATVRPGEVVAVRVTGFDGGRILLQIVGNDEGEPASPSPPVAPPPGAFVAASIRPAVAGTAPPAAAPAPATVPARAAVVQPGGAPSSIEARLAAARAALAPRTGAPSPSPAAEPPRAPAGSSAPPAGARFVAPPPIAVKPPFVVPRPAGLAAYAEPAGLLRGLRLPATAMNLASAALALERPDRLPAALAALEQVLPGGDADPQVATLRTLLAFVGRLEPRSPVLAAQIAAFVEHAVDGAEPKLATLLAATRAANPEPDAALPQPALPAALAAERSAALGADLKQTLLALAADPATPEPVAPALTGALTALTAVQTQAAQLLASRPDGVAFTLPLATPHGQQNARIVVQREAPQGRGVPVDGANFRIAFVLDTAHYGTVAIDLVTVGREVAVDVRAQSAPALRAFRAALGGLTARLESLRYRVASAATSLCSV